MNRQDFLESGKLDFTVSKQKMYTITEDQTANETPFFATVNNTTGEALGPVRSAYTVKQNHELLDVVLNKIGEGKYDLEESKCGVFNHGRKVYFFIKTTHQADWGQEKADTYVYALSSHDGSQKLVFGVCNQIHSCANMFGVLMNDKDKNHIIKHTKSISDIEESNTLDEMIRNNITGIANLMKTMQRHEILISDEIVGDVMDLVANSKNKRKTAIYHERRELLSNSIVGEFREKGHTYYGLFNGITHYLTHSNKSEDSVMDNIAGKASEVSKDAVQLIIKHMKDRGCLN